MTATRLIKTRGLERKSQKRANGDSVGRIVGFGCNCREWLLVSLSMIYRWAGSLRLRSCGEGERGWRGADNIVCVRDEGQGGVLRITQSANRPALRGATSHRQPPDRARTQLLFDLPIIFSWLVLSEVRVPRCLTDKGTSATGDCYSRICNDSGTCHLETSTQVPEGKPVICLWRLKYTALRGFGNRGPGDLNASNSKSCMNSPWLVFSGGDSNARIWKALQICDLETYTCHSNSAWVAYLSSAVETQTQVCEGVNKSMVWKLEVTAERVSGNLRFSVSSWDSNESLLTSNANTRWVYF